MFLDFSSAFNAILPDQLGNKLRLMNVNAPIDSWIMDYLTNRPQFEQHHGPSRDCSITFPLHALHI